MRTVAGETDGPYVVGAMFTSSYRAKAEQLAASCDKYALPYALHEVPTVHRSISGHGTDDPAYTKANFIHFLLKSHRKPVLYVDADCEFMAKPELIDELVKSRCDFAIYNWYADDCTDCFIPVELDSAGGAPATRGRFYRFLGREEFSSHAQLKCNGLVQYYANSMAARGLLARWHRTIATFPGCTDDSALSFTFNNLTRRSWISWRLHVYWLPKAYARISWWIYEKPIINHADLPSKSSKFVRIKDPEGRRQFYPSLMEQRQPDERFPPDCIIDTERRLLCRLEDGRVVPIAPTEMTFWL